MALTLPDIISASGRIKKLIHPTPVLPAPYIAHGAENKIWLKLESLNVAGSFKIRGASNAILLIKPEERTQGVVAASAGNHAQGVASIAKQLGIEATIFMPVNSPLIKYQSTLSLGAKVVLIGQNIDDAINAASEFQEKEGGHLIHAYANDRVIAGQGTIGLELLNQIDSLGAVIVPIGGGGLISGIACSIKEQRPDIKIIGVQTESFPSMEVAVRTGCLDPLPLKPTIAEGIAIKRPNPLTVGYVKKYVDDIILVTENDIAATIMILMERGHLLVEGAGAAAVAAILKCPNIVQNYQIDGDVACIISGGNIDVNLMSRIIARGTIYSGRRMKIKVMVTDQPGNLAHVLSSIGKLGANIIEVYHNRVMNTASHFGDVEIFIDIETLNKEHQEKIDKALEGMNLRHEIILPGKEALV